MIKNLEQKICSFEVLETCVVRKCGTPHNLFDLLAIEILGKEVPESYRMDFAFIRIKAEAHARSKTSKEEITLAEIYANCDFTGITTTPASAIQQMEINLEKQLLLPVFETKDKINARRAEGFRIVFVSDTYLPEFVVLEILESNGFIQNDDQLYVSSRIGLTKQSGNLYKYIARENNYSYNQWIHYGNSYFRDVRTQKKLGIKAIHLKFEYNNYEKEWIGNSYNPAFFDAQVLAGISRAVRLNHPANIQIDFTVNLIAPLYTSLVLKMLDAAHQRGINQLFFLARDGYILYLVARKFQHLYPEIKFQYIYVSRKSLYLPGLFEVTPENILSLLQPIKGRSIREILDRLNLETSSFCTEEFLSTVITDSNSSILMECLQKEKVLDYIRYEIVKNRELVLDYFKQVELASTSSKNAIVDLRGTRTCHESINAILTHAGFKKVEGFYLEVVSQRKSIKEAGDYSSFLFTERINGNANLEGFFNLFNVLEQFFSITDQMRTVAYERKDGMIVPLFEHRPNTKLQDYQNSIAQLHYWVIDEFVDYFIQCKLQDYVNWIFYTIAIPTVCKFGLTPSRKHIDAVVNFCESDSNFEAVPFVKKLNLKEFFYLFLYPKKIKHSYSWFIGIVYYNMNNVLTQLYLLIYQSLSRHIHKYDKEKY